VQGFVGMLAKKRQIGISKNRRGNNIEMELK
jgi:hypothetical protein